MEMQRLIREEEAQRPSTRLSSLGGEATVMAGNRGTDPKRLVQMLSGDLDWIVMKALEKDRNRRYASPGTFADDIARYLRGDAVGRDRQLHFIAWRNSSVATAPSSTGSPLF